MTPPVSGSAVGTAQVLAALPPIPLLEPELVVYFREQLASLHAFLLIDSLLDPPRA